MTAWQTIPRDPDLSCAPYDGKFYTLGSDRDRDFIVAGYWDVGRALWDTLDGVGYSHDAFTHYFVVPPLHDQQQVKP